MAISKWLRNVFLFYANGLEWHLVKVHESPSHLYFRLNIKAKTNLRFHNNYIRKVHHQFYCSAFKRLILRFLSEGLAFDIKSVMINDPRIMHVMKYLINRRSRSVLSLDISRIWTSAASYWNSADDFPQEFIRADERTNRREDFGMGYEICDSFKMAKLNVCEITSWAVWGLHRDN